MAIRYKTYYYLSFHVAAGIFLLGCSAALVIAAKIALAPIALLLSAMVFTAHYGIEIDTTLKTYLDYFSILGFRSGETHGYAVIDYVFLKTSNMSKAMNSMVTSKTFVDQYYDGYIKFDGKEKVFLMSHRKKDAVMKLLTTLSESLAIDLLDYTENPGE